MSKCKAALYRGGLHILGILPVPFVFLRWCIRFCLAIISGKSAPKALSNLFLVDDDLAAMINITAGRYGGGIHVKHRLTAYHDFFTSRIEQGAHVLDIGCGNGALAFAIASRDQTHVTAIDNDAKTIEKCKLQYSHQLLEFKWGDALSDLPDKHYDVIVLSNVLEHIDERASFLEKLCHKYNPDKLLIRVPMVDRSWRVPARKELGLPYFSDDTHYTEYTLESFKKEMENAGLIIDTYQINWGEIWAEIRSNG